MIDRVTKIEPMTAILIAPCGMNCRLCRAYVRERNPKRVSSKRRIISYGR